MKNKDIAVIAVLHDLPVAEAFADRIPVLNESRRSLWYARGGVTDFGDFAGVRHEQFQGGASRQRENAAHFDVPHCA